MTCLSPFLNKGSTLAIFQVWGYWPEENDKLINLAREEQIPELQILRILLLIPSCPQAFAVFRFIKILRTSLHDTLMFLRERSGKRRGRKGASLVLDLRRRDWATKYSLKAWAFFLELAMRLLLSFSGGIEENNLSPYKDFVVDATTFLTMWRHRTRGHFLFSWARLAE